MPRAKSKCIFLYVFQSTGVENRAGESDKNSRELLENGRHALNIVQTDLQPHMDSATSTVKNIQDLNIRSDFRTTSIQL